MSRFATVSPDAPVRVVLVGAGSMGRHWLQVIAETPAVELVGLVDLDLDLAHRVVAERRLSIAVGNSVTAVAEATSAQAVIDVTVPPAHHAVNTEALLAGLPVLCEKPIAPTVAETLSLAAAAELSGQLLMTSQSRRYYPALAELKGLLPVLGDIGVVSTEFFKAPHFGGFRDEMAQPLLVDMAIHAFDVSRYLLDTDPVSVDCHTFNPSWSWYRGDAAATAAFVFEGGTRYVYTGSWCSPGLETSWNGRWRLSGARGTATWDGEGRPEVDLATDAGSSTSGTSASETATPETATRETATPEGSRQPTPTPRSEIAGALDEFIEALRTGRTPSGDVRSNVRSLAMVEAAVLSAETAATVELNTVFDDAYRVAVEQERRDDVRAVLESWGSAAQGLAAQGLAARPER